MQLREAGASPDRMSIRTEPHHDVREIAPAGQRFYLVQAEACLAAAAHSNDASARRMHEDECKLWLMLARQRRAIDAVMESYLDPAGRA